MAPTFAVCYPEILFRKKNLLYLQLSYNVVRSKQIIKSRLYFSWMPTPQTGIDRTKCTKSETIENNNVLKRGQYRQMMADDGFV